MFGTSLSFSNIPLILSDCTCAFHRKCHSVSKTTRRHGAALRPDIHHRPDISGQIVGL